MKEKVLRIRRVPLQHGPLLPVPGRCLRQGLETIVVPGVDDAQGERVARSRRPVVEVRLMSQHKGLRSVPGRLFVIPEKMMLWPPVSGRTRSRRWPKWSSRYMLGNRRLACLSVHFSRVLRTRQGTEEDASRDLYSVIAVVAFPSSRPAAQMPFGQQERRQ